MKKKSKNRIKKHQLPLASRLLILLIGAITIISMMMMPAMQQNSGEAKRVMVEGK